MHTGLLNAKVPSAAMALPIPPDPHRHNAQATHIHRIGGINPHRLLQPVERRPGNALQTPRRSRAQLTHIPILFHRRRNKRMRPGQGFRQRIQDSVREHARARDLQDRVLTIYRSREDIALLVMQPRMGQRPHDSAAQQRAEPARRVHGILDELVASGPAPVAQEVR